MKVIIKVTVDSGVLKCHQCSGWHGRGYAPSQVEVSNCDNMNNQCQTQQFCVKKIDPIVQSRGYVTFTSDCWQTSQIQVSPTNLSTVVSGQCYPYQEATVPPKRKSFAHFILKISLLYLFQ
ncbi:unnamed protein product [Enterobius vermicularis]|uniref:Uncharacterized protein n=1 Tax=Enterobius vermicularis TaxID=51028 RepID=A0A3P6IWN7_ENTVE|nr:unnamed protein product [Enterobius vermicularis]